MDDVWRCCTPEKPRPDSLDRTQLRRPYTDRVQYAVPPGRPEGRSSVRGTLSRDWQFGSASTLQKREVMPGNLRGAALEDFIRDETSTYHHQTCTAKMGRDSMSVVDGQLKVYGI